MIVRVPVTAFRCFGAAAVSLVLAGCVQQLGSGVEYEQPEPEAASNIVAEISDFLVCSGAVKRGSLKWEINDGGLGLRIEANRRGLSLLRCVEIIGNATTKNSAPLPAKQSKKLQPPIVAKSAPKKSRDTLSPNPGEAEVLSRRRHEIRRLRQERRKEEAQIAARRDQKIRANIPAQSSLGSGFFVSRLGHVITNAHVVKNCSRVTVGDSAKNQTPAALVNTDNEIDLALLKLGSLETTSAQAKSLIRSLGLAVSERVGVGLLRSDDVDLGESVLVSGYPYGDIFSSTIKVTGGMVSSVRGIGDDIGQFQMDAAVQLGSSGGPIYDQHGNIVGVVIAKLNRLNVAKAIGSLPENVNFGIKASTVRRFLTESGLQSKSAKASKTMSTKQLAKIAQKQTLMVTCHAAS